MNKSKKLCAIGSLLLLSVMAGCSGELPPANREWVPVKIHIGGIEQIEVSPLGTKAWDTELPSIVKTVFNTGDEIKLTYTDNGAPVTVLLRMQANGSWDKPDGSSFTLPASTDNRAPAIKAEYGTPISENPGYSTTDYLIADATTAYDPGTKMYTCSIDLFKRPSDYTCLCIQVTYINPPKVEDGEAPLSFTEAQFYTEYNPHGNPARSPKFPMTNDFINVFVKGTFLVYGIELFPFRDDFYDVNRKSFNYVDGSTTLQINPGNIVPVQVIIPFHPMS